MFMYGTAADLQEVFHVCRATVTNCRRFIRSHPERYTSYGTLDRLTNMLAFADALKYRGYEADMLPPFDPEEAATALGGYRRGQL